MWDDGATLFIIMLGVVLITAWICWLLFGRRLGSVVTQLTQSQAEVTQHQQKTQALALELKKLRSAEPDPDDPIVLALKSQLDDQQQQVIGLNSELEQQTAAMAKLSDDSEQNDSVVLALKSQLEEQQQRVKDLNAELERQAAEAMAAQRDHSKQNDSAVLALKSQLEEQQQRVRNLNIELEQQKALTAERGDDSELNELKSALKQCSEARAELEDQIRALQAKLAARTKTTEVPVPGELSKQEETLRRVRERAEQIDFVRIGTATEAEKDDLKRIKGIGPFIERKLNSIGIYTFQQIANFNPNDEETVNEAIEFFSGRIRRDEWSRQARELMHDS